MNRYFLVLEEDVVIAADIEEALREAFPDTPIVLVESLDAAMGAIAADGAPRAVIVNWPYSALAESELHDRVIPAGGKIIVTRGPGQDLASIPSDWVKLSTPFTSDILLNAVAGAGDMEPSRRTAC